MQLNHAILNSLFVHLTGSVNHLFYFAVRLNHISRRIVYKVHFRTTSAMPLSADEHFNLEPLYVCAQVCEYASVLCIVILVSYGRRDDDAIHVATSQRDVDRGVRN